MFVKLGPKLLPSPQLGDTIRSPVAAEELHQDGLAPKARARECVAVFIDRRERAQALAHSNRIVARGLRAHVYENAEKSPSECRDDRRLRARFD